MIINCEYSPFPAAPCSFFMTEKADLATIPECPCGSAAIDVSTGDVWICFPEFWQKFGSTETVAK